MCKGGEREVTVLFIWFPGILSPTPPWKRSAFPSHSSRTTCNIPGHTLLAALRTLVPGDPNATVSTSGKAPCELNPSNLHSFSAPMPALQACLPWLENEAVRRSFRRSGKRPGQPVHMPQVSRLGVQQLSPRAALSPSETEN